MGAPFWARCRLGVLQYLCVRLAILGGTAAACAGAGGDGAADWLTKAWGPWVVLQGVSAASQTCVAHV